MLEKSKIQSYEDLVVYQKAYAHSLEIHRVTLEFPQAEQYELGQQLRRVTKSVAVNIAEGFGKKESNAEFKRFIAIARGSNNEVRVWLRYCKDLGYISMELYEQFERMNTEIGKMLTKIHQTWL